MMTSNNLSPSSASASPYCHPGRSATGSSRGASNRENDEPYLEIKQEPPKHLYSNESFKVDIQLMLPQQSSPPKNIWNMDAPIDITASLHYAKTGKPVQEEAMLMTKPMQIIIPPTSTGSTVDDDRNKSKTNTDDVDNKKNDTNKRMVTVECMIRIDRIRRDIGADYTVRFRTSSVKDSEGNVTNSKTGGAVQSVSTRSMQMVNYKIRAKVEEEWDAVWYKDEGGRDKCMEVFVAVYDKDGQPKTGEQILLEPILCYMVDGGDVSPTKVANQDILRILGSVNGTVLDKDTGRARLRFRVEDVSKNHQGHSFVLQIGPVNHMTAFKDIAPAYTPAVSVRSKRNKRSRGSNIPRGGGARQSVSGVKPPAAIRQKLTGSFNSAGDSFLGASNQNFSLNPAKSNQLQQAMAGIIQWVDSVVNGLYPLQWSVLGYQQHSNGEPNYSKPFHNMPNPNPSINEILTSYTDTVQGNLRILLKAVEEAHTSNTTSGGGRADTTSASAAADYMASSLRGRDFTSASNEQYLMKSTDRFQGVGMMASNTRIRGEAGRGQTAIPRPSMAFEGYRQRNEATSALPYQTRTGMTNSMSSSVALPGVSEGSKFTSHASLIPQQNAVADTVSQETEIEYVLGKQYKTLRCGERLGYPCFNENMEILGFYRECTNGKPGLGQFISISRHADDFGPLEIMQSSEILRDFIEKGSDAVLRLKDHGSIRRLLDAVTLYDWTKDISGGTGASSSLQS